MNEGEQQTIEARVLVGADGAQSLVAKSCGLGAPAPGPARFALGGHYGGLADLDAYVQMFVEGRTYFALNPLTPTTANAMLIVYEAQMRAHRENIDAFMRDRAARLSGGRLNLQGMHLLGKRVAIGPLAHRARAFSAPGVLLAGDAAQFVDPFTGQGVYLALFGARLAASAIRKTIRGWAAQPRAWREYERSLKAEVRRRRRYGSLVSVALRFPLLAPHARLLAPLLDAVSA